MRQTQPLKHPYRFTCARYESQHNPLVALAAFSEEVGGVIDVVKTIEEAAQQDVITSDGKALGQREEAVLQALEILSRDQAEVWIKAGDLREQVRDLLGYSEEVMGSAPWVGHLMKRLQLTDRTRRKAYAGGQMYLIQRPAIEDMMRRYDVSEIEVTDLT